MSETSTADPGKPMKQPIDDLAKIMGQLSVTSNETSPSLSDMPIDVVALIIDRSEYKEQLRLCKVSKPLRALVDKQKPACKSIQVELCAKIVYIKFNGHNVTYSKDLSNVRSSDNAETSINIVRDDFKKVAFDDLASTLKNPRLQLDEFSVSDFTPRMEQVALLEQWKQAEELELKYALKGFQMEYATHFKRFHFFESAIDGETFDRIKDFLSKSNNFEQGTLQSIGFHFAPNLVYRLLGAPVSSNSTEEIFHYPIPGSDYYLEFRKATMSRIKLEITKKKREVN
ncbi:unnamed protein product [Caenorhabditis brenneri]